MRSKPPMMATTAATHCSTTAIVNENEALAWASGYAPWEHHGDYIGRRRNTGT